MGRNFERFFKNFKIFLENIFFIRCEQDLGAAAEISRVSDAAQTSGDEREGGGGQGGRM